MEPKYHFISASTKYYKGNSFDELLKEEENYGGCIYWHIGNHKIHKNDICYIYYSKLPDNSSRILFASTVIDSDLDNNSTRSICPDAEPNKKYMKLKLKSVSLEDNSKFNIDKLRGNKYNLLSNGQFSYLHIDPIKHKKLIKDITTSQKNTHYLKKVHEYFEEKYCICEFNKINKCKTFIEENGFHYIERHHLVPKNVISKYKNIKDINELVYNKDNTFYLCPLCHKKIHHAKIEERKKMIDFLYNKNKTYLDDIYTKIKGEKSTLEWLYEIYNCK